MVVHHLSPVSYTHLAAESVTETTQGGKVGVCIYKFDDAFMTTYRNALQEILEGKGYEVTIVDGNNDQAKQNEQINTFITQGVDALIINPCLLYTSILGAAAFFAPFADRFNAGVSTSFYNTADWDGGSRINFTLHIDDWASDAAAQYGTLAHSLLNGRLDLEQDPPAAMQEMANPYDTAARQQAAPDALWDVAYYQGRYYVYFGVIPCLLFQLPFEALTEMCIRDRPQAAA